MAEAIVKRVGGKTKIRSWLKSKFPSHSIFNDCFGGSGAVVSYMPKANGSKYRKVYNDQDNHVSNFFKILRDEPQNLAQAISLSPYSRKDFDDAHNFIRDKENKPWLKVSELEWARQFLIYNRQSIFGKEDSHWCIARNGENICITWHYLPKDIIAMAECFKETYIECLDYQEVIKKWDSPETLTYMDPPYEGVEKDFYQVNKESGFNHEEMRKFIDSIKGSVAVSYYDSKYIRDLYSGFEFHELKVKKNMQTKEIKDDATEILIIRKSDWAKNRESTKDIFE